jgi:hypothetical protein
MSASRRPRPTVCRMSYVIVGIVRGGKPRAGRARGQGEGEEEVEREKTLLLLPTTTTNPRPPLHGPLPLDKFSRTTYDLRHTLDHGCPKPTSVHARPEDLSPTPAAIRTACSSAHAVMNPPLPVATTRSRSQSVAAADSYCNWSERPASTAARSSTIPRANPQNSVIPEGRLRHQHHPAGATTGVTNSQRDGRRR